MKMEGKTKCRDYNPCLEACLSCDITTDRKCGKRINLDRPKKYIHMGPLDKSIWNECPTCGASVGYHPKDKGFRCKCCNQLIAWD